MDVVKHLKHAAITLAVIGTVIWVEDNVRDLIDHHDMIMVKLHEDTTMHYFRSLDSIQKAYDDSMSKVMPCPCEGDTLALYHSMIYKRGDTAYSKEVVH